ncbi:MAG: DUF2147 domain-containing protein [Alphaproteobacteria bacterium]|nr:DUF2147 domain-containing protein [Alphaproteobacteria bacterium]
MNKTGLMIAGALGLAALSGAAYSAATPVNPYGDWTLSDGRLTVKVVSCMGNRVCANVIRLQEPNNGDGTPKLDLKNKNPALRSRHLIGMPVIEGMEPTGPNTWKGQIYSSDDGDFYRAYATVNGDHLSVKGCWFVICKDLEFNRAK